MNSFESHNFENDRENASPLNLTQQEFEELRTLRMKQADSQDWTEEDRLRFLELSSKEQATEDNEPLSQDELAELRGLQIKQTESRPEEWTVEDSNRLLELQKRPKPN